MASIAMLLGGAAVNALAFSGSNYLFSMLRSSGIDEERKRHDQSKKSGPNSAPRSSTGSMKNSAARAMLFRLSTTLTWRSASTPESPGITSITPLVLWGRSPKSLTSTRRAVTRKTARSPSSSWGWPQPALWPISSPSIRTDRAGLDTDSSSPYGRRQQ